MSNIFFTSLNNIYLTVHNENLQKEFKSFAGTLLAISFLTICLLSGPVIGKILFDTLIPHPFMYEVIVIFSSFVFSMLALVLALIGFSKLEHLTYQEEYTEYF